MTPQEFMDREAILMGYSSFEDYWRQEGNENPVENIINILRGYGMAKTNKKVREVKLEVIRLINAELSEQEFISAEDIDGSLLPKIMTIV